MFHSFYESRGSVNVIPFEESHLPLNCNTWIAETFWKRNFRNAHHSKGLLWNWHIAVYKAMYHWLQRNVTAYLCSFPEACKVRYGWFPNVKKQRVAEITTTDLAGMQLECLVMWLACVASLSVCIFPEVQKETKRLWLIDVLPEKAIRVVLSQLSKQSPKRVKNRFSNTTGNACKDTFNLAKLLFRWPQGISTFFFILDGQNGEPSYPSLKNWIHQKNIHWEGLGLSLLNATLFCEI